MSRTIAIIGAGLAGLTAARTLADLGFAPTVFDKSRGLGGRMATRRTGGHQFDHGAQYFSVRGAAFRQEVDRWSRQGAVAAWQEAGFVGSPGMTAPAHALAAGLEIVTDCPVASLTREKAGWRIATAQGEPAATQGRLFESVIVAAPAPQTLDLLPAATSFSGAVAQARLAPCWALMLALAGREEELANQLRPGDDMVAWIARDSSKPGRPADTDRFVLHATPQWSREHLEEDPQTVLPELVAAFRRITGARAEIDLALAHRWRFALVETAAGVPCLWDPDLAIGACGDWCIGPRVEAAFDSGLAMAQQIAGMFAAQKSGSFAQ